MKLTKREEQIYELGIARGIAKGFNMALELTATEPEQKPNGVPLHPSMDISPLPQPPIPSTL